MSASRLFCVAACLTLSVFACGKKDEQADPNTAANANGQPGYPQQPGQPGYPQQPQVQPGYPQQPQVQPGYPQQPAGYPPVAPQPAQARLATPGPTAFACQNDTPCMTHKCNLQFGKCAFPCETDNDCTGGNYCFKGPVPACLPRPPGQ
jgi:hypothetical protein